MTNHNYQRRYSTAWVVVADEAIALSGWPGAGHDLQPVEELTDPDAHAKFSEFRNDAFGRRSGTMACSSGGSGTPVQGGASATASAGDRVPPRVQADESPRERPEQA